jgi:hypothetical protein
MIVRDDDDFIHKTGLKLDYNPKRLDFNLDGEFPMEGISQFVCGSKHYVVVNKETQMMLTWGRVFKQKPVKQIEGFDLYETGTMFEEGEVK